MAISFSIYSLLRSKFSSNHYTRSVIWCQFWFISTIMRGPCWPNFLPGIYYWYLWDWFNLLYFITFYKLFFIVTQNIDRIEMKSQKLPTRPSRVLIFTLKYDNNNIRSIMVRAVFTTYQNNILKNNLALVADTGGQCVFNHFQM